MLTPEQIAERKNYIGGSDIAGILGLSRWTTPLAIWAEKTGQIVPEDISDKLHVKLGDRLEATVCDLFTEETGKQVRRVNETIRHPKYPFLAANIDRRVLNERAGLEAKTASAFRAKEWDAEEIPQEYICQAYWYLAITGLERWYIACLIGNQKFVIKTIERDEKVQGDMIARAVSFWNDFVIPKVMPGQITAGDADTLYALYPIADPESKIELGDDANQLIESRNAMYQDVIQLEKQIEQRENELKALLGDKAEGFTANWQIFWKNQAQVRLDTNKIKEESPELYAKFGKEIKFRKLSIKEAKSNGKH